MTKTFTIHGTKIRTATTRRYVVVYVGFRFDGVSYDTTGVPARVEIFKRSDSIETARKIAQRQGFHSSRRYVIVDTTTGEAV